MPDAEGGPDPDVPVGEGPRMTGWHLSTTRLRVSTSAGLGLVVALATAWVMPGRYAPIIGWDAAALVFLLWTWLTIWPQDPAGTRRLATREDPSRATVDVIMLCIAGFSLGAVALVLFGASGTNRAVETTRVLLSVFSVAVSWTVVHSVYCLKYASLYYSTVVEAEDPSGGGGPGGGIGFAGGQSPDYADFAYLAFTIGMTYQVSDTDLTARAIRRAALRHSLFAFVFGTVILAVTINLVAGLSK